MCCGMKNNATELVNYSKATVWQCCGCSNGWWSVDLDYFCPHCLVPRCTNCQYAAQG
ncbi:hypothetical protein X797_009989 [Metarhizium robertsii]|uniref:Uncharacterized protein n=1 Tax=Metarhizium robertsii TaxID=568076 RepID=A0A0A1UNL6_9HYPO|nr:hypothetical protein X797_009989 [Metarhizium robertsii]